MSNGERRSGPLPPDFLILGAQKCGTTSLASALRSHPQVFIPAAKEAHHFGKVDDDAVCGDDYLRFFRDWRGEPVVGEATPNYLQSPRGAEQICRFLPEVKAVAVLRNPVDRAYSAYWNGRRVGRLRGGFAEVIESELAEGPDVDRWFRDLLERGRYAEQLQRYLDLGFDRRRLCVLVFEEMASEPRPTLQSVQEFLGVEPLVTEIPRENEASSSWLPRRLRSALAPHYRSRWARTIANRTRRRFAPPPMDPALRARLIEYFRPHNLRLAELLGRDLSAWDR